jgi:hypothetical protein
MSMYGQDMQDVGGAQEHLANDLNKLPSTTVRAGKQPVQCGSHSGAGHWRA